MKMKDFGPQGGASLAPLPLDPTMAKWSGFYYLVQYTDYPKLGAVNSLLKRIREVQPMSTRRALE